MSDYISRDDVINVLYEQADDEGWWVATVSELEALINSFPAEDVAPVMRAKWELDSDKLPTCSNCGEIALQRIFVKVPHLIQDVRMVMSNFCPNCGADLRGDADAEK